ncbi:response regulator transcription factor [Chryseobacterium sp. GP-SGM7]|uniref:response regulator transcription factor n=1 Tax=Chryseobacterium sp. GP-SGM7 TaxID=3411323 RepID=UPI003B9577FF
MEQSKIKVGIVDDDKLFVQLLKQYINTTKDYFVVQTYVSGNQFLNDTDIAIPQILLLDLRMSDGDGLAVLSEMTIRKTEIKIIVLSSFYRRSFMGQMLKMGAHAFLSKEIDLEDLIKVMHTVHHHGHYFSKEQVELMRSQLSNRLPEFNSFSKDDLTEREIDVLKLVCQQLNTKEIADTLFISPKTVETHKSNLMVKTGVKNSAGLVIYAVQNNIINAHDIVLLDK